MREHITKNTQRLLYKPLTPQQCLKSEVYVVERMIFTYISSEETPCDLKQAQSKTDPDPALCDPVPQKINDVELAIHNFNCPDC